MGFLINWATYNLLVNLPQSQTSFMVPMVEAMRNKLGYWALIIKVIESQRWKLRFPSQNFFYTIWRISKGILARPNLLSQGISCGQELVAFLIKSNVVDCKSDAQRILWTSQRNAYPLFLCKRKYKITSTFNSIDVDDCR